MPSSDDVYAEINEVTAGLIKLGLADEQNFPSSRYKGEIRWISVSGGVPAGLGFGGGSYRSIHEEIRASKAFNVRLLDGGLLLLQYTFHGAALLKHRLAYWSSPTLEAFQNEPELYEADDSYLDFIEPSTVPFPLRFDFDLEEPANAPMTHPRSHMTLGQYKNCRVPVCSPLMPSVFVDFVLRNFYSSAYRKFSSVKATPSMHFAVSLYDEELSIPHMVLTHR